MEDLITQVRAGSHEAFATLVGRFQPLAIGMAFTVLHDHHLAEDAAQRAFVTAHQCIGQLKDPGAFPGWFRTLVLRQARRTQRELPRAVSLPPVIPTPAVSPGPLEAAAQAEDTQCVHLALSQLPDHLRITTVLFYFHASRVGEIAQFLEVPATTIKKRLVDARRRLKAGWEAVQSQLPRMKPLATQRFMDLVRSRTRGAIADQVAVTPEKQAMPAMSAMPAKPLAALTTTRRADPQPTIADLWQGYKSAPTEAARNSLVEHYLPLVQRLAQRMAARLPSHVETEELSSSGIFGLLDAIDSFDPDRGFKFETFAARRIQGAMLDEIRARDWVPRLVRSRCHRIDQAARQFAMQHGRPATEDELKRSARLSDGEFARVRKDAREVHISSMNPSATRNEEDRPTDRLSIADPRQVNPISAVERLCVREVVLREMTRAERLIVILYYYEQLTMKEIGATLDLSESRVSQMHTSILARLKARLTPQLLEEALVGA